MFFVPFRARCDLGGLVIPSEAKDDKLRMVSPSHSCTPPTSGCCDLSTTLEC
jgi:hypothetical protein